MKNLILDNKKINLNELELLRFEEQENEILIIECHPICFYHRINNSTTEEEILNLRMGFRREYPLKVEMRSTESTKKDAMYNPLISYLLNNNKENFFKLYRIWFSNGPGRARMNSKILSCYFNKQVKKYFSSLLREKNYRINEFIFGEEENQFFNQSFINDLKNNKKMELLKNKIDDVIQSSLQNIKKIVVYPVPINFDNLVDSRSTDSED